MGAPIYLDHNATTPLLPEVYDAILPYLREHFGNPSSGHAYGRRARAAVEEARSQVSSLLGCAVDEVIFTSGGTEANNLAIRGVAEVSGARRHVITSTLEHPATAAPCLYLAEHGYSVDAVAAEADGRVRASDVGERMSDRTALVTVMHANNETGTLQPIAEIARAAHACGAAVHTDAAQSVGKIAVRVDDLGVDLLTLAGHKLNAPKGVGALYVRRGIALAPFVRGAGHERGLRPGTENVASIVGLGVACSLASRRLAARYDGTRVLRDRLWTLLSDGVPGIALNGHATLRLPNTLNVRFPGATGSAVLAAAPEIAASTGSACHEGDDAASFVRLSVGITTTEAEVDTAAAALVVAWQRAKGAR